MGKVLIALIFFLNIYSFSLIKTYGDILNEEVNHILKTSDGGFLLTGYTMNQNGFGGKDILIIKTDNNGSVQWKKIFGGNGEDEGFFAVEYQNNYYVIGITNSIDNDQYRETLLLILDQNGTLQSAKMYQKVAEDIFPLILEDPATAGNFYIIGNSSSFELNLKKHNVVIMHTDSNGDIVTDTKVIKPCETDPCDSNNTIDRSNEYVSKVITTSDGGLLIGGVTDFPSSGTDYDHDVFLIKLDSAGNIQWSKRYAFGRDLNNQTVYDNRDSLKNIIELFDNNNNSIGYIVVGTTTYSDTSATDIFILKLDSNGVVQSRAIYCIGTNSQCNGAVKEEVEGISRVSGGFLLFARTEDPFIFAVEDQNLNVDTNLFQGKIYKLKGAIHSFLQDTTNIYLTGYTQVFGNGFYDGTFIKLNLDGTVVNPKCQNAVGNMQATIVKIDNPPLDEQNFPLYIDQGSNNNPSVSDETSTISKKDIVEIKEIDACEPHIVPSIQSIDFGNVYLNMPSSRYLIIKNRGLQSLEITNIYLSGTDKDSFGFESQCFDPVPYQDTCYIKVLVNPKATGTKTAQLIIESNDPSLLSLTINLKATATVPPTAPVPQDKKTSSKKPVFTNAPSCSSFHIGYILLFLLPSAYIIRKIYG